MKRLLLLLFWLPTIILTLGASLLFYTYRSDYLLAKESEKEPPRIAHWQMYASFPKTLGASTVSIQKEDAITELVSQYLKKYNSPMQYTASSFVTIFRKNSIDPIIPLAIAQCESNLGLKMPENCHNPFGLGIHSRGRLCFETWELGYEKMAKTLKENYIDQGLVTPDEIMQKYCPLSLEKGGSWAKCVNQFSQEIESLKTN
jgi:hypothetical protein